MTDIRLTGVLCVILALLTSTLESASADDSPVYNYWFDITQGDQHTRWEPHIKNWNAVAKDKSMVVDVPRVQEEFRNLHARQDIPRQNPKLTVRLFVGDIFEFIGRTGRKQTSEVPGRYDIDALIISTNNDTNWRKADGSPIENPTIQMKLFNHLKQDRSSFSQTAFAAIDTVMENTKDLDAPTGSIAAQPIEGFSPRLFCFVAADRQVGGTFSDHDFMTKKLTETRLAEGIRRALDFAADKGSKSVVLPFIGSSRPDLRTNLATDQNGYLNKHLLKNEIIKRLEVSLGGIQKGVASHHIGCPDSSIKEIGIVLHFDDVLRIASGSNGWNKEDGVPALEARLASDTSFAKGFEKAFQWDMAFRNGAEEEVLEEHWCVPRAELEKTWKTK